MRPSLLRRLAFAQCLILNFSFLIGHAQAPKTYTSSDILLGLHKLNTLGSVLYIAAHPDDENTRLLAYLANERHLETAYLSCTRGDGGQNLLGPELREELGLIRTQELLAARRLDGADQFFTRANDFGFSKTAAETFTIWDKEQVLSDMVWVIRQRRPDVLITRFPPDARAGHGHHQASALLAAEAFDAAGDPKRFPEQLQYVQPWQPKRLLWNTGSFFVKPGEDMSGYLKLDAGGYNPLLGKSYGEIAALSRSQHRSQGMGTAAQRGEALEYFQLVKGAPAPKDILDGVDTSWNRVPGGEKVGKLVAEVIRKYDAGNPSASVAGLLNLRRKMSYHKKGISFRNAPKIVSFPFASNSDMAGDRYWKTRYKHFLVKWTQGNDHWSKIKLSEANDLALATSGIFIEATGQQSSYTTSDSVKVSWTLINRSKNNIEVNSASFLTANDTTDYDSGETASGDFTLKAGTSHSAKYSIKLPVIQTVSSPYWLLNSSTNGMYRVSKQSQIGLPESQPVLRMMVDMQFGNRNKSFGKELLHNAAFTVPVQYKHTDPVLGERYQPLAVVPPVLVNLPAARAYVFADAQPKPKPVPVTVRAGRAGVQGTVALQVPAGWQAEPASAPFALAAKDAEQTLTFQLRPLPGAAPGKAELHATATVAGQAYTRGIQTISYPHIPTQTLFPEASAPLVRLAVQRRGQQIGYLMGAGDEVPEALRQLGYTVTLLDPATDLTAERLRRYDAVVLGIRAYNTVEALKTQQPELLKYAAQGGTVVVQYTVTRGVLLPQIGPFPLTLSNNRITVEGTPVTFLNPKHPLLTTPNQLVPEDFATGWVQEQGLYYPSAWDAKYQPVIASHDPGEADQQSAILVADVGKGHYIYTGLALFRQLPAGVPGAYRVLANLVSYGK